LKAGPSENYVVLLYSCDLSSTIHLYNYWRSSMNGGVRSYKLLKSLGANSCFARIFSPAPNFSSLLKLQPCNMRRHGDSLQRNLLRSICSVNGNTCL
jgi:hypothetical protein